MNFTCIHLKFKVIIEKIDNVNELNSFDSSYTIVPNNKKTYEILDSNTYHNNLDKIYSGGRNGSNTNVFYKCLKCDDVFDCKKKYCGYDNDKSINHSPVFRIPGEYNYITKKKQPDKCRFCHNEIFGT